VAALEEVEYIPGKSTLTNKISPILAASDSGKVYDIPVTTLNAVVERVGVTAVPDKGVAEYTKNSYSIICQFFLVKSPFVAGVSVYTITGI
jgi:hypothetical protein